MKSIGMLITVVTVTFGYTQAPDTLWTRTYGGAGNDVGNSITQTSDGGYIIVGQYGGYLWLLKTDSQGDTLWTKTYGAGYNYGVVVQQTTDSGYFVAGQKMQFVDDWDLWLLKIDSLGDTLWTRTYGDTSLSEVCRAAQQTSDGGYIVAGYYNTEMGEFPFLLKANENGDTVWTHDFGVFGVDEKRCHAVSETWDGGYIVAGDDYIAQGAGKPWLAYTDANGNTIWSTSYLEYGRFYGVKQTSDSGYVACGYAIHLSPGFSTLYLVKTDFQGDTLWTRHYGDTTVDRSGSMIIQTDNNDYIITGACREGWNPYDLLLFKTNENGDSLWCSAYGGSGQDMGKAVQQSNDGGYIVVGFTESFGAGGSDVWIIKTEPDVGIEEQPIVKSIQEEVIATSIFRGPLQLPEGKNYRVFDITGRIVEPTRIAPGIYFVEIDNEIVQKVVKIR